AVDFSKEVVFKGLKIQGIIGRRVFESWEMMRSLLASGLTQTFLNCGLPSLILPLAQYQQGLDALIKGAAVKVVLKP
ncbi:MAG TPA: L-threonine 3-dehydrogenase, partial [Candidatus Komeilibacteria bacterium]|nr:L-threonine 3-dehydrogenase [Candidatus Komeilibacteria bacterium]